MLMKKFKVNQMDKFDVKSKLLIDKLDIKSKRLIDKLDIKSKR